MMRTGSGFVPNLTDQRQIDGPAHLNLYLLCAFSADLLRDLFGLCQNRRVVGCIEEDRRPRRLQPRVLRGIDKVLHERVLSVRLVRSGGCRSAETGASWLKGEAVRCDAVHDSTGEARWLTTGRRGA